MPDEIDATGTTVLVVDDSDTDRTLVTGLISSERPDWTLLPRSAAAEGLEVLASQTVTAVVTDLFMPEMTGEEFLVEVRRRFPAVPVILITSQGSDEIAARSLELGAVNYVPKRRLAEDLIPALDEILRSVAEASVARDVLSHLIRSQTTFRIYSNLEEIRALLHLIRERLQTMPTLQDDEARQVTDAVREALMNAHSHGQRPDTSDTDSIIEVELTQTDERVCFTITDQGAGFDTSTVAPAGQSAPGTGFHTIQRHMDHIEFNERGNCIALSKSLSSRQ